MNPATSIATNSSVALPDPLEPEEHLSADSDSDTQRSSKHAHPGLGRSRPASSSPPNGYFDSSESENGAPLLPRSPSLRDRPRWWDSARKRRYTARKVRKTLRTVARHPLFPVRPITILLALLLFALFAVSLTLLLIYILNPDKEPLPWRAYCSVPSPASSPHYPYMNPTPSPIMYSPLFPPGNLEFLAPAGVFLGVFSMDSSLERRMLVRTTWVGHPRSRNGAGPGDGGNGTSRTIVRFILGQPRPEYKRQIQLEMEKYHDIVILPVTENMNNGKTHAFFTWAATSAWVPPSYFSSEVPAPPLSYSNVSAPAPALAVHDPAVVQDDAQANGAVRPWVRPDFVLKCDDDSFVMLAELEARLRVELHYDPKDASESWPHPRAQPTDPLVYWGYLVKNRFMGGEIYGLSWALTTWVAGDPQVRRMTRGAEDKQTAKWMNAHPERERVRWKSERCWIYNHPRSGTVYSHGFLYPSEVTRARQALLSYLGSTFEDALASPWLHAIQSNAPSPSTWAHSSVSTFGARYFPPVEGLSLDQSVEALVEGSEMSMIRQGSPTTKDYAWSHREGRLKRYQGIRVGGTVVVHFIKKHSWFLETALAMLEGSDYTEAERARIS